MKATIIRVPPEASSKGVELEYPGWIVPHTNDAIGIDMRYEGGEYGFIGNSWFITHLPSGRRVHYGDYTEARSKERAVEVAQRFYKEAVAIGADFSSMGSIVGPINALTKEQRKSFWYRVAGWTEPEATASAGREA